MQLIDGGFSNVIDEQFIIDCRFPYEYNGGHIDGAINVNSMEELEKMFFENPISDKRIAIIFHCEFSSHRAPRM